MAINLNSISYLQTRNPLNSKDIQNNGSGNFIKSSKLKDEDYIIKLENFSFDKVQTDTIQFGKPIFENNYSRIFDERVSVDDVRQIGIGGDTQAEYETIIKGDGTGIIYNTGETMQQEIQSSAEKYDILAKQIYENHGNNTVRFNKEMESLNKAFKNQNVGILNNMNRETFYFLEKELASQVGTNSSTIMDKYTESFLKSYDVTKNVDYSKKIQELLTESFPAETTSLSNISFKDYEIISNTQASFFNRGTGFEILESLAQNKDLSGVIRKQYDRVVATGDALGLLVDVSKLTRADSKSLKNVNEKKNDNYAKTTRELLQETLSNETVSKSGILFKDYEIIKKTKQSLFNKSSGLDIINSLAQNKELSSSVRAEYAKIASSTSDFGLILNSKL